ncbi:MAG: phosphoenolpyruvate--protein phosphotransferase, partial [Burkholderiales bacterium]|nr:phosphoenolpyruvate--protein phosphotransferase [Burkholderiales bacterium]
MVEKIAPERKVLHGIGISNGLGWGRARVMAIAPLKLPQYSIKEDQVKPELQRFQKAITGVNRELAALLKRTPKRSPKEVKSFLEMFRMLINDETLHDEVERIVRERLINVEWALAIHLEEVKSVFENMSDSYLSERGDDIEHAVNRLQQELAGVNRKISEETLAAQENAPTTGEETILVTSDLSLADVIWLTEYEDLDLVGIITEKGGPTSHTAVLSQTLFIPAVVGVPGARSQIKDGEIIFIDSSQGSILCNPTAEEIKEISQKVQAEEDQLVRFAKSRRSKAITKDKHKVKLMANIAMVAAIDDVLEQGAEGIGLYRSEYLFMGRDKLPDEEEQYESYKSLIDSMEGKEIIIRTLDVGGDKLLNAGARASGTVATVEEEDNPALGLRAIRCS